MRRHAAFLATLATLALLTACAPEQPTPEPTPAASEEQSATPSPTPSLRVVGASEMPPTVFGGDCETMLTTAQASAAVGAELVLDEVPPLEQFSTIANAGGLMCSWNGTDGDRPISLSVGVFPDAGMEGVDADAVDTSWTDPDCGWYCAVVDEVEGLTVITTLSDAGTETGAIDAVARIGDVIAPQVAANHLPVGEALWVRDRTGWAGVSDCAALSAPASARLGFAVESTPWSIYVDPPLQPGLVADEASSMWSCLWRTEAGAHAEVHGVAGAWGLETPEPGSVELTDLPDGWSGVVAEDPTHGGYTPSHGGFATDGVNVVRVAVSPASFGAEASVVVAALVAAFSAQP